MMTWAFLSTVIGVGSFLFFSHFLIEKGNTSSMLYFFLGVALAVLLIVSEAARYITGLL